MARVNRRRRSRAWIAAVLLAWSVLLPSIAASGAVVSATYYPQCKAPTSDFTASSTAVCELEIVSAPSEATTGEPFSVTVRILKNGAPLTSGACASGTLSVALLESDASVVDGDPAVSGGVATFDVTIGEAGTYHLLIDFEPQPYTNCGAVGGVGSDAIEVTDPGVVVTCPPNTICTASTASASGNALADITASGGATITAGFSTLGQADYTACGGVNPRDAGGVLTFDVTSGKLIKVVKFTLKAALASGPLKDYGICWNAPTTFKTAGGSNAAADPLGGFTGLLSNCLSINPKLPCIALRAKNSAGDVSLWVLAKPGDPKGYIR
jgi:hypothetical protein